MTGTYLEGTLQVIDGGISASAHFLTLDARLYQPHFSFLAGDRHLFFTRFRILKLMDTCKAVERGLRCTASPPGTHLAGSRARSNPLTSFRGALIAGSKWCPRHEELQAKSLKTYKVDRTLHGPSRMLANTGVCFVTEVFI